MKKLYFLDEEEKKRILNLHESATKRHYLGEQQTGAKFIYDNPNDKAYDYKMENGKYYFKGKPNTSYATKYPNWYEAKAQKGINAIKALFDKNINVTQTEVKTDTNPDPSKAATVTANVAQTTASGTTSGTTSGTPATNAGSGVISLNINDIVATPETGTETSAVAGTQVAKPTSQFKDDNLPKDIGFKTSTPKIT